MLRLYPKERVSSRKFIFRTTTILGGGVMMCVGFSIALMTKYFVIPRPSVRYVIHLMEDNEITPEQTQPEDDPDTFLDPKQKTDFRNNNLEPEAMVNNDRENSPQQQLRINSFKAALVPVTAPRLGVPDRQPLRTAATTVRHKAFTTESGGTNSVQTPKTRSAGLTKPLLKLSEQNTAPFTSRATTAVVKKSTNTELTKEFRRTIKYRATDYVKEMASKVPSIPLSYLSQWQVFKPSACAQYPHFYYLHFNNDVWQHFQTDEGASFYIFGAYYDNRRLLTQPVVRILTMVNRIHPPNVTCQLWYPSKLPNKETVVALKPITIWRKEWGNYKNDFLQPFMITCPLRKRKEAQKKQDIPASVSLVNSPCQNATNNIRIFNYRYRKKKEFAVCVKGLNFLHEDVSVRLVEWIEFLKILGANKIFFYDLAVHPNVSNVLDYYVRSGLAERTMLTLPGMQLNYRDLYPFFFQYRQVTKRQNELIPYNDCFYKNIHRYKYVLLLDTDEVIVPLKTDCWEDLMKTVTEEARALRNESRSSYAASNVYFFDDAIHHHGWQRDIPKYMHMLQHVWRAANPTPNGAFAKSFFNTEKVLTLHNHRPLQCLGKGCFEYSIPTQVAQLQHYRKDCDSMLQKTCQTVYKNNTVIDNSLRRFRVPLVRRTQKVLKTVGFLSSLPPS